MNYILTLDIGTTNIKATIVDEVGNIVIHKSIKNELTLGSDGRAEHDIKDIYRKCLEVTKSVISGFERNIVAISLSTYLHGLAVLGVNNEVLNNVMTHLDLRSAGYEVLPGVDEYEVYRRTGCPPIFVYPVAKIRWFKSLRSHLVNNVSRYSLVKDYVVEKLIGDAYVDFGVASGSQLLNIHSLKWDDLVLSSLGIDEGKLPRLVEGCKVLDYVRASTLDELGIMNNRVALVAGTFDGGAQNIGLGALDSSIATVNLGSTAVLRTLTTSPIIDKSREMRFFTYYVADGLRACGGASNNGCTVLDWLSSILSLTPNDIDLLIKDIGPGSEGVYFLPFLAGERFPFRDPYLRGVLIGLQLHHGRGHIIKALLEGISLNLRVIKDALGENGINFKAVICGGGGCRSKMWREVLKAVLCMPILSSGFEEHAANRGVGLLALKALGYVNDLSRFKYDLRLDEALMPDNVLCDTYSLIYSKYLSIFKDIKRIITNTYGCEGR